MPPSAAPQPTGRTLVVLLHGFRSSLEQIAPVRRVVKAAMPGCVILAPPLPLAYFSFEDPVRIVADVMAKIDAAWQQAIDQGDPFTRVHLVGHSMGAVLARKIYACAWGPLHGAAIEPALQREAPRVWAPAVERLVLLAGMNRGWAVSSAMGRQQMILWALGSTLGHLIPRAKPTIFAIRRGAPFLSEMRLQWLAMRRERAGEARAITVQLLGSVDDLVSPEDNVDLATGGDFFYLTVPRSGHKAVLAMDPLTVFYRHQKAARARARVFTLALCGDPETIRSQAIDPRDMDDTSPQHPGETVTDVAFVIHGIRDRGFWTKKIAQRIKELARLEAPDRAFRSVTATYGYFGMGPFVLPWYRRAKVEWLMDRYVEARALYPKPDARFHYVGHSNGTYLLARALLDYPSTRFENVAFAGSVVRRGYHWSELLGGRVRRVLNYVATADGVVAVLPKGIAWLSRQDIGGAGHDGFSTSFDGGKAYQRISGTGYDGYLMGGAELRNIRYVSGGHSAALAEHHWEDIARFVIHGRWPEVRDAAADRPTFASIQDRFWLRLGNWSGLLVLGIATVVLLPAVWLFGPAFGAAGIAWLLGGLFVGYLLLLGAVLLRL